MTTWFLPKDDLAVSLVLPGVVVVLAVPHLAGPGLPAVISAPGASGDRILDAAVSDALPRELRAHFSSFLLDGGLI